MKKRYIAAILALSLVFTLIPLTTASAAGNFMVGEAPYSSFSSAWTDALALLKGRDITLTLGGDVNYGTYLEIPDTGYTLTIDLNGYTIRRSLSEAVKYGSVIWMNDESKLVIKDSVGTGKITGGKCSNGGGGIHVGSWAFLTIEGGNITGNESTWSGGGICLYNHSRLVMTGGSITNNWTDDSGGGIYAIEVDSNPNYHDTYGRYDQYVGAVIRNAVISSNIADEYGGGIYMQESNFEIYDTDIYNNSSPYGGGIYGDGWGGSQYDGYDKIHLTMNNCDIRSNTASIQGGGFYFNGGEIESKSGTDRPTYKNKTRSECSLINCRVNSNTARQDGGGIYIYRMEYLTLDGSRMLNNYAWQKGGAICYYKSESETVFRGVNYISGNNAGNDGGAILSESSSIRLYCSDEVYIFANTANGSANDVRAENCYFYLRDIVPNSGTSYDFLSSYSLIGLSDDPEDDFILTPSTATATPPTGMAKCFFTNKSDCRVEQSTNIQNYVVYKFKIDQPDPIGVTGCVSQDPEKLVVYGSTIPSGNRLRVDGYFKGEPDVNVVRLSSHYGADPTHVKTHNVNGKTFYCYDVRHRNDSGIIQRWLIEFTPEIDTGAAQVTVNGVMTPGTFAECWTIASAAAAEGLDATVKLRSPVHGALGRFIQQSWGEPPAGFGADGNIIARGPGKITLDLSHFTLHGNCNAATAYGSVITAEDGSNLEIIGQLGDATITGGWTSGNGGGINAAAGARVSVENVFITGNKADGNGGGIYVGAGADVTVINSHIRQNRGYEGPGMYLHAEADPVTIREGTHIIENNATGNTGKNGDVYLNRTSADNEHNLSTFFIDFATSTPIRMTMSSPETESVKLGTYGRLNNMAAIISYAGGGTLSRRSDHGIWLNFAESGIPVLHSFSLFGHEASIIVPNPDEANSTGSIAVAIPYSKRNDLKNVLYNPDYQELSEIDFTTSANVEYVWFDAGNKSYSRPGRHDLTVDDMQFSFVGVGGTTAIYILNIEIEQPIESDIKTLTIFKNNGDGVDITPSVLSYTDGDAVEVTVPINYAYPLFTYWEDITPEGPTSIINNDNRENRTLNFTMPGRDVTLRANYTRTIPSVEFVFPDIVFGEPLPQAESLTPYAAASTAWIVWQNEQYVPVSADHIAKYNQDHRVTITFTPVSPCDSFYINGNYVDALMNGEERVLMPNDLHTEATYSKGFYTAMSYRSITETLPDIIIDEQMSAERLIHYLAEKVEAQGRNINDYPVPFVADIVWETPTDFASKMASGEPFDMTGSIAEYLAWYGYTNPYSIPTTVTQTVRFLSGENPAMPTASVEAGDYDEPQTVALSAAEGTEIYYTIDGSDPATNGVLYSAPIEINDENGGTITLKAIAQREVEVAGVASLQTVTSPVAEFAYRFPLPPVQATLAITAGEGGVGYVIEPGSITGTARLFLAQYDSASGQMLDVALIPIDLGDTAQLTGNIPMARLANGVYKAFLVNASSVPLTPAAIPAGD